MNNIQYLMNCLGTKLKFTKSVHQNVTLSKMQTYKIALLGDAKVGKTSYVHKLLQNGRFSEEYKPTLGVEVHPILLDENTRVNIWDTAGENKYNGLRHGYLIQAQGAIIMFSNQLRENVV